MALEVYYPQDIERALRAADQTLSAVSANGHVPDLFAGGFRAALVTLALSFGVDPDDVCQWRIIEGESAPVALSNGQKRGTR